MKWNTRTAWLLLILKMKCDMCRASFILLEGSHQQIEFANTIILIFFNRSWSIFFLSQPVTYNLKSFQQHLLLNVRTENVLQFNQLSNLYLILFCQNPLCARSINLFLTYSQVNDFFEKAVMLLPMENCDSSELQEMYLNFIHEFGTHYTTEVVMGAKAVQQLTFSKSDLSKLESEGISAKVSEKKHS